MPVLKKKFRSADGFKTVSRHQYINIILALNHFNFQNIFNCYCQLLLILHFSNLFMITGDRSSTVVKVACYKSEGRWFDPGWCQWILH